MKEYGRSRAALLMGSATITADSSYRTSRNQMKHDLPETTLYALGDVVSILASFLEKRLKIHIAVCLCTDDEEILNDCQQYCKVPFNVLLRKESLQLTRHNGRLITSLPLCRVSCELSFRRRTRWKRYCKTDHSGRFRISLEKHKLIF